VQSAALPDDSNDSRVDREHVEQVLRQHLAELDPLARRVRAALLRGESPESLGLVENGLAEVLRERGIE